MSRYAKRDWSVGPHGLTLTLSVEVNGKVAQVQSVVSDEMRFSCRPSMPAEYIEREMRRQLMAHVEEELLGPRR